MRVLIADKAEPFVIDGLRGLGCEVEFEPSLDGGALTDKIVAFRPTALVVRSTKVPSEAIDAGGDDLRLIIRAGSGYDNIAHEHAAEKGVGVCNCPGTNAVAVAELTLGHLISLDRWLPQQDAALRAGQWDKARFSKAVGLKGRSLLVIGTGAIGIEVIRRAQAFGMEVSAQSRSLTEQMAEAMGVRWIPFSRESLLEALPRFDAVSIHTPSNPLSDGMCDSRFFAAMKEGALFINTSRADLVDEAALVEVVQSRGIRAALDVFDGEPSEKACSWRPDRLIGIDGIQFSHHVGASTAQAQAAVGEEVLRIVEQFRESGTYRHRVNG